VGRETGAAGVGRLSDVGMMPGVSSFEKEEGRGELGLLYLWSLTATKGSHVQKQNNKKTETFKKKLLKTT
jgi:hypothetical protein